MKLIIIIMLFNSMKCEMKSRNQDTNEKYNLRSDELLDEPNLTKLVSSYCNGEWCDPSHEPYPNIVSVMTGYDILKGNPFPTSQTVDPGFSTGYIFVPTTRNYDGTYALHSGITVRQTLQCSLTSNTDTISTANQYVKEIYSKSSQGKELTAAGNVKGVSLSFEAAFTSSNEYKKNQKFFTEKQGVITLREATCATYSVHISPFDPPPFSDGFIKGLQMLETTLLKNSITNENFENFVKEFGTHFLQQTTMGARTAITRRYSNEEFKRSTDEELKKCSDDRLKLTIAGYGIGTSTSSCQNIETSTSQMELHGFDRESVTSYGSKPENDLSEWSKQNFESPLPIKMELRPITDLLTENYMRKYNFKNYTSIQIKLTEFYNTYCDAYKESLEIENCHPNLRKKCGLNDICNPRTEICSETGLDTKCLSRKCVESNPCKNGAQCEDIINNDRVDYKCKCTFEWEGATCNNLVANIERIFKEITDKIGNTNYKNYNHDHFVQNMNKHLNNTFTDNLFVVNSMNPVEEFKSEIHAAIGDYVPLYMHHNRNVVIGWANKKSYFPLHSEYDGMRTYLSKWDHYSGVSYNAKDYLNKLLDVYNAKYRHIPYVFMQVVQSNNGFISYCSNMRYGNIHRPCLSFNVYYWNPLVNYHVITILFGSMKIN